MSDLWWCNRLVKEKEKEWKWNGPLYSSSTELEVPYCNVVIYNPSAEGSLRFSMFLGNVERLEQLSMYSIVDIQAMLAIFRNPAQIAQLGPLEKDDAAKLTVLSQYMVKAHKVRPKDFWQKWLLKYGFSLS